MIIHPPGDKSVLFPGHESGVGSSPTLFIRFCKFLSMVVADILWVVMDKPWLTGGFVWCSSFAGIDSRDGQQGLATRASIFEEHLLRDI